MTDVLQIRYISNIANAAGVPTSQVRIIAFRVGSLAVETAVILPADLPQDKVDIVNSKLTPASTTDGSAAIIDIETFGQATVASPFPKVT